MKRLRSLALVLALLAAAFPTAGANPAPPPQESRPVSADGFLYGTVRTEGGKKYTGVLRWGTEEAFWDDLFNGDKADLPYLDRLPEERRRRREIQILGLRIRYDWDEEAAGRQFIARFGDIKEIRPRGGGKTEVVMKNGVAYALDGGSNDIGATVRVQDPKAGVVEIEWRRIERIDFFPAPPDLRPGVGRLAGDVTTDDGVFSGFIQWDSEECLSDDKLDGYADEGKLSLEMGGIRSIEKSGSRGSDVEMKDGRKFHLHGTNDVNSSIRGIFVEDPRYGRVKVSWDSFRRAVFKDLSASGRAYGDYKPATPLRGSVTDRDHNTWKGRLVFDLDETETWEMLNGDRHGIEYNVPFGRIRAVRPVDDESSSVTLKDGGELRLEAGQDVTRSNAGVLVISGADGKEHYVAWDRVRRIDLE